MVPSSFTLAIQIQFKKNRWEVEAMAPRTFRRVATLGKSGGVKIGDAMGLPRFPFSRQWTPRM